MKLRELLQQLRSVQRKIGVSVPFLCGGTPRDKFMGRLDNVADIDITTGDKTVDYLSQEFAIELRKKYNVVRKTMDDGHSTIFIGNLKVDFSSNFVVANIDQYLREVGIANPTDMQREMFSRDFTCNALLLTIDLKKILDPTKRGFRDIRAKKIVTCLPPEVTLTSNRNRVVRAIYLACKLGFEIDPAIVQYVREYPQIIRISTPKVTKEKLASAFDKDPEKAADLISQMGLWNHLPILPQMQPYYTKKVTVMKKQMKIRTSLLIKLANDEKKGPGRLLTRQDLGLVDENDGPNFDYGKGPYSNMDKYKSIRDFEEHADKGPGAFFADDNADHMLPPKEHGTKIYDWRNSPYQGKPKASKLPSARKCDDNEIDFPVDDDVNHDTVIRPEEGQYHPPKLMGPSGTGDLAIHPGDEGLGNTQIQFTSPQISGQHSYVPEHDFDGRSDDALNFGRDYDDESAPVGRTWDDASAMDDLLDMLSAKYLDESDAEDLVLEPAETEIYGLPDGVEPRAKDADQTIETLNPEFGTPDAGRQMYEDKWNI